MGRQPDRRAPREKEGGPVETREQSRGFAHNTGWGTSRPTKQQELEGCPGLWTPGPLHGQLALSLINLQIYLVAQGSKKEK